jgi:hypothetical protein
MARGRGGRPKVTRLQDHSWWSDMVYVADGDRLDGEVVDLEAEECHDMCWRWTGNRHATKEHKGSMRRVRPLVYEALRGESPVDWLTEILAGGPECADGCMNPWHMVAMDSSEYRKVLWAERMGATRNLRRPVGEQEYTDWLGRRRTVDTIAKDLFMLLLSNKAFMSQESMWDYERMMPGPDGLRLDVADWPYVTDSDAGPFRQKVEDALVSLLMNTKTDVEGVAISCQFGLGVEYEKAAMVWKLHVTKAKAVKARRR